MRSLALVATLLLSSAALADEPLELTDSQMDQVTSGGVTSVFVATPNRDHANVVVHNGRAYNTHVIFNGSGGTGLHYVDTPGQEPKITETQSGDYHFIEVP